MMFVSIAQLLIMAVVGYQTPAVRATTVALPSVQAVVTGNSVLATASVNEKGAVTDVRLLQGHQPFTDAVVEALSEWQFRPALADGSAVSSETAVLMTVSSAGVRQLWRRGTVPWIYAAADSGRRPRGLACSHLRSEMADRPVFEPRRGRT
jgi:hypothetical protein